MESGHIPGAVSLPWRSLMTSEKTGYQHLRPVNELQDIFRDKGIDLTKPLTVSCGSDVLKLAIITNSAKRQMVKAVLIFLVILLFAECTGSESPGKIIDHMLNLNDDGTLKDPEDLPDCGHEQISIIGSAKLRFQDHFSEGWLRTNEKPLSKADEFVLHSNCSWRNKCNPDLKFEPIQLQQTNAVNIKYRCLAPTYPVVNMCVKGKTYFTKRLHLTINDSFTQFQKCECFINNGRFSVTVNDLVLTNKESGWKKCTSAKLGIENKWFECSQDKVGFGSVFNLKVIKMNINCFISLKSDTQQRETPAMVMLTLIPEERAMIECMGGSLWATPTTKTNSRQLTTILRRSSKSTFSTLTKASKKDWSSTPATETQDVSQVLFWVVLLALFVLVVLFISYGYGTIWENPCAVDIEEYEHIPDN